MIISTIPASNCTPQTIVIGRRGTYDTMQIAFDLSYLIENYGSGTAVLAVKRSQDESAYPAVVTQDGNTLTWTITETDTYYVGSGECQLMWYVDGSLAKTIIYPMVVMRDILSTAEEPPDGYENWIEHLTELGAETQQNAQDAAQSASDAKASEESAAESKRKAEEAAEMLTDVSATATTLDPGQPATAEYNDGVFEFGIPKGDKLTYADLTEADKEDLVQGPIKDAQDDAIEAVGTAKTNAVDAVNQAGTTQKNAVNQAGTTAVNAVGREGTTQVERVTTEGNTQVGRVQDKGNEVIASIPSDYSDLSDEVDNLNRQISDVGEGYLLFDIVRDSYITTSGVITPYTGWSRTDYIACDDYDTVEVEQLAGAASMYNVFYDSNKEFISGSRFTINPGINTIAIPDNAAYFILSNATTAVENYKIRLNITSVEIVGYTNPYYNLSALIGMSVTFKFDTITFLLNNQIVTKTWNDLKTEYPGVYLNVDDAKMREVGYTTENRYRLIVNKLGRFKWTTNTQNTANTVIGADWSAGNVYEHPIRAFGTLTEYVQQKVFNAPRKLQEELPLDVVIELDAKEDTLYSKFDDSDFVMGYYSDNHMYGFEVGVETPMTTLALSRYDKHIDFDSILCCGDSVLSYGASVYQNDGSPYTALINANFMIDRNKLLFVEGNHDRNIVDPVMPTKDFINLMYRPLKKQNDVVFGGAGKPYFYRDFSRHKIRIICLDLYDVLPDDAYNYHSGYKQDQMEWLANVALNVPDSGWNVLVATHASPYGESDGMTDNGTPAYNSNVLIGILESFKNGTSVTINSTATIKQIPAYSITTNFSTAGNLIGCFVGHNHVDVDLVKNGIHYVSIECGYVEDNDKEYRAPFSYSAIAFDVVVINTANRTVNFHRIGYGEDRDYTY